jgi:hypothetical protein
MVIGDITMNKYCLHCDGRISEDLMFCKECLDTLDASSIKEHLQKHYEQMQTGSFKELMYLKENPKTCDHPVNAIRFTVARLKSMAESGQYGKIYNPILGYEIDMSTYNMTSIFARMVSELDGVSMLLNELERPARNKDNCTYNCPECTGCNMPVDQVADPLDQYADPDTVEQYWADFEKDMYGQVSNS